MKRNHCRVLLIVPLCLTLILCCGCSKEVRSIPETHVEELDGKNLLTETKGTEFFTSKEELLDFDEAAVRTFLRKGNAIIVTDTTTVSDMEEVVKYIGTAKNLQPTADLQSAMGMVLYADGKQLEAAEIIGQCILPEIKKESDQGRKDEKGKLDFIVDAENARVDWRPRKLNPEDCYEAVRAFTQGETEKKKSRIFIYYGWDGSHTKALGTSVIESSVQKLKRQSGYAYIRMDSQIKVYAAEDAELRSFNVKQGVKSDGNYVLLNSQLKAEPNSAKTLPRIGYTYTDAWSISEIKDAHMEVTAESVVKYKSQIRNPELYSGLNYVTFRFGKLDYTSPTDPMIVSVSGPYSSLNVKDIVCHNMANDNQPVYIDRDKIDIFCKLLNQQIAPENEYVTEMAAGGASYSMICRDGTKEGIGVSSKTIEYQGKTYRSSQEVYDAFLGLFDLGYGT